jgi:transitional endoplasmic reticulum ATPase
VTKKKVDVIEVVKHGTALVLPDGMSEEEAIIALHNHKKAMEEPVDVTEVVNVSPYDGANALRLAMEEMFGWVKGKVIKGGMFTPDVYPEFKNVATGVDTHVTVPWGRFELPGFEPDEEFIDTGYKKQTDGTVAFQVIAHVMKKREPVIQQLFARTREILETVSIYRGGAFRVKHRDQDGKVIPLPDPRFVDLRNVHADKLLFNEALANDIRLNLWTTLRARFAVAKTGADVRRGFLLAGPFGTGKSYLARVAASIATQHGWTFIYVEDPEELGLAYRMASQYQPAMVFVEDVDRVAHERDERLNALTTVLDGVDTKTNEIIVVMTTNHPERIHPVLLRPGRVDVVLPIDPPDAETVGRLIRAYGGDMVAPDVDVTGAANVLGGHIPAVVMEALRRAKLAAIDRLLEEGETAESVEVMVELGQVPLESGDLYRAARSVDRQVRMLAGDGTMHEPPDHIARLGGILGAALLAGVQLAKMYGITSPEAAAEQMAGRLDELDLPPEIKQQLMDHLGQDLGSMAAAWKAPTDDDPSEEGEGSPPAEEL